jgi:ribokinase
MRKHVLIAGSFVVDLAFRTTRLPVWGETVLGESFAMGPGGKGSNQAVAAARAGAQVRFLTRVGDDAFGTLGRKLWADAGIDTSLVSISGTATGAAAILVDAQSGENAIIVTPGACFTLSPDDMNAAASALTSAAVFMAQLELPIATVQRGLQLARAAGVPTILNPAPAPKEPLPDGLLALADFLSPNETEAALLVGLPADSLASGDPSKAEKTADLLLNQGAGPVSLTLGSRGSLLRTSDRQSIWISPHGAGKVIDTTGAGDAFCGAFAAALARGETAKAAAHFASVAAGISVTRTGTAGSMPVAAEIEAQLAR